MLRCYIQTQHPEKDIYCLGVWDSYLCVYDDYIKIWQSKVELGTYLKFGMVTWFPVGWNAK